MDVSVLIVNWNGRRFLDDCLLSLNAQTYRNFEVVLVDNGSTDGSVDYLRSHLGPRLRFPLRLLPVDRNLGFAGGNNHAFEAARGRYLVTLNNDTLVAPGFLGALATAAATPRCMCACKILNYYDQSRIDSIGLQILGDAMAYAAHRGDVDAGQFDNLDRVLIPSACAALYPRQMIDQVGFFDEDFFAYCEDTDLGLRGLWAGYRTVFVPGAVAYHKYSGSSGALSATKAHLVERNHYWVALKNLPARDLALVPVHSARRYAYTVAGLLARRGPASELARRDSAASLAGALVRALRDALLAAPRMLSKRADLRPTRTTSGAGFRSLLATHRGSLRELALGDRVG